MMDGTFCRRMGRFVVVRQVSRPCFRCVTHVLCFTFEGLFLYQRFVGHSEEDTWINATPDMDLRIEQTDVHGNRVGLTFGARCVL